MYPITVIGLTGRAGSGKTYAQKVIEKNADVLIIDLDVIGHQVLTQDDVKDHLVVEFGKQILTDDEQVNRPVLGSIVFNDKNALDRLNQIVHPALTSTVITLLHSATKPVLIVGALLYELNLLPHCNAVVLIITDEVTQRVPEKTKRIRHMQRSIDTYKAEATVIIKNDLTETFEIQIKNTLRELLK